jgi:hypothetical protein
MRSCVAVFEYPFRDIKIIKSVLSKTDFTTKLQYLQFSWQTNNGRSDEYISGLLTSLIHARVL